MTVPVTVIGGYLGSGKTTLINRLLRFNEGLRLAVLVNEFGELPIDQDLIVAEEDRLITLAGGCVCCTFGSDLAGALADLLNRNIAIDHILVEASGVAIPSSIVGSISLLEGYQANSTIVLADADQVRENADAKYIGDTILRQLADADLVLITKCDLVDGQNLKMVAEWCAEQTSNAQVMTANNENISTSALLAPTITEYAASETISHAQEIFETKILAKVTVEDPEAFAKKLASEKNGIVRAKGYVTDKSGQKFLIQIVGSYWNVVYVENSSIDGLVVIGLRGDFKPEMINWE